jgi:hypothetical protein
MAARRLDILSRLFWPLLVIAAALVWLLHTLDVLPPAILDLIGRGWPALLVGLGLFLLLGRRVRFGNLIAIGGTALLIGGVMVAAYNREGQQFRDDYREPVAAAIGPEVDTLRILIEVRSSEVDILPVATGEQAIQGEYVGSLESQISAEYRPEGRVGIFTLRESARNTIPLLAQVGRGRLRLHVPEGITIEELSINTGQGDVLLNISAVSVRRLVVTLEAGSIDAQFPAESGLIGDLRTGNGDATLTIPSTIPAEITLSRAGSVTFDDDIYTRRIDNVLVPRASPQMQITVNIAGAVTIN